LSLLAWRNITVRISYFSNLCKQKFGLKEIIFRRKEILFSVLALPKIPVCQQAEILIFPLPCADKSEKHFEGV